MWSVIYRSAWILWLFAGQMLARQQQCIQQKAKASIVAEHAPALLTDGEFAQVLPIGLWHFPFLD